MKTRPLSPKESRNLAQLNQSGQNSVLLFTTRTGIGKSILDATEPMRRLLRESKVHDYSLQPQGKHNKVYKTAVVLGNYVNEEVEVSLYRPDAKKGDPRLWPSRFGRYAEPEDVFAVFVHEGKIHLLNLTRSSLANDVVKGVPNACAFFLQSLERESSAIAKELLDQLRDIAAAGPLKAVCKGDTSIGRSIEAALGIKINSSRKPDYKGIELKSSRSHSKKDSLFGCVPDWHLSTLKSSLEILDRFGYHDKKGIFAFRCTVTTTGFNPNGLILKLDEAMGWLRELYRGSRLEDICVWDLDRLHKVLTAKHGETFWIKADSIDIKGHEHFLLRSALHTSKPSCDQFDRLLVDGSIFVDHLSEEKITTNRRGFTKRSCDEKGPLFRIKQSRRKELFLGFPADYDLQ